MKSLEQKKEEIRVLARWARAHKCPLLSILAYTAARELVDGTAVVIAFENSTQQLLDKRKGRKLRKECKRIAQGQRGNDTWDDVVNALFVALNGASIGRELFME